MSAPEEATELLLLGGGAARLALEASRVAQVVAASYWRGEAPVELEPGDGGDGARVLVVQLDDGRLTALRVAGRLELARVGSADVLPLPALLRARTPWIRAAVFPDDAPPLLVIDPARLARR